MKKRNPYSAWLIRAEQMQDILTLAERLNILKPDMIRLIFRYVLFFTEQNFVSQANVGELRSEYTRPDAKLMVWMKPEIRTELNVALGRIDTAKTESDVVRMAISYVFDFHLGEFLQHLEEDYDYRHIREPVEKE